MISDPSSVTAASACYCGNEHRHRFFTAREMMFGIREEFRYRECLECGCLNLEDIPADLSRYYPPNYYSFTGADSTVHRPRSRFRRWMFECRNSGQILGTPAVGTMLARFRPRPDFNGFARFFRHAPGISFDSSILDIGCGRGDMLHQLAHAGFRNVWGVDPYLDRSIEIDGRLRILASGSESLPANAFELIMLHHSLEHMLDQRTALTEIKRMLATSGTCLIRIPLAGSDPWNRYGADWVELDPPRHICLHTSQSLKMLVESVGLKIVQVEYDSDAFAYWGSELYQRDIPLFDPTSNRHRTLSDYFTQSELDEFEARASRANAARNGGRAAFFLRHGN